MMRTDRISGVVRGLRVALVSIRREMTVYLLLVAPRALTVRGHAGLGVLSAILASTVLAVDLRW